MADREVVFCMDQGDRYGWFWHEADVLLYILGQEVAQKRMTAAGAREVYVKHYDVEDTYLIDPGDVEEEKRLVLEDSDRYAPQELEEILEGLVGEYGNFPLNEELEHLPNSSAFWWYAAGLGIPGVEPPFSGSPASGEVFEVEGEGALRTLRERLRDGYRIVAYDGVGGYAGGWSVEEARRHIEEAREGPVHTPTMPEL